MTNGFNPPGQAQCRFCGQTLPPPSADETCDSPACRSRRQVEKSSALASRLREKEARDEKLAQLRTDALFDELARRLGVDSIDNVPSIITPHVAPPMVDLDYEDVIAFTRHLCEIVEHVFGGGKVFAEMLDATLTAISTETERASLHKFRSDDAQETTPAITLKEAFAIRDAETADDSLELNASCIACGGNCCTRGRAQHSYLRPADIAYFRHKHPEATPASIIAYYLSHLPERSLAGSCLFLTETGCTQPRSLRSVTCNRFQCGVRIDLANQLSETNATISAVIGLAEDHETVPEQNDSMLRAVTVKDGVVTVHSDLHLPAIDTLPDPG